jgi:hypothetical protein
VTSTGVGGNDGPVDEVGVALTDSLPFVLVATGKLSDNRFGRTRGVYDNARACFTIGRGGGAIAKCVRLGEFPTCGVGSAPGVLVVVPEDKIDSTEAGSIDKRLGEVAIVHIVL